MFSTKDTQSHWDGTYKRLLLEMPENMKIPVLPHPFFGLEKPDYETISCPVFIALRKIMFIYCCAIGHIVWVVLPKPSGAMHPRRARIDNAPWMNAQYRPEVMP